MARDILKTLKNEHDELRKLFKDMEDTTDRAKKTRAEILADMHFHLGRAYDGAYDARAGDEYVKAAALFSSADQHGAAGIAGKQQYLHECNNPVFNVASASVNGQSSGSSKIR